MDTPFALLPQSIFLHNRRWVKGKALRIAGGKIVSIVDPARLPRNLKVIALPGIALLPGFWNAHTHLEYTDASFRKPPKHPGFVQWLNAVFSWKAMRTPADTQAGLRRGADMCVRTGTVAVGDHYCGQEIPRPLVKSPLKGIVFHEIISRNPAQAAEQLKRIQNRKVSFPHAKTRFGVALHAPYSVSPVLMRNTLAWARKNRVPLTMHVAESREEAAFFAQGARPLATWLEKKSGVCWTMTRKDPIYYVAEQGLWKASAQAVHMNLAKKRHLALLPRARVFLAYCPQSHEYFGHPRFELEMFLANGYCVALGTDSLASNTSLSMWEELRMARQLHPKVSLTKLWDMATVAGAKSLGCARSGRIEKSFSADIIGIDLKSGRPSLQKVFAHHGPVPFAMIDGKIVFRAPNC